MIIIEEFWTNWKSALLMIQWTKISVCSSYRHQMALTARDLLFPLPRIYCVYQRTCCTVGRQMKKKKKRNNRYSSKESYKSHAAHDLALQPFPL